YRSRSWFDPAWMTEHGNLAEADLHAKLRECSWGFSPMALTDDDPQYNRFSFPTKFISYLAAGLPVNALGHPESSLIRMAAAYPVGVCLTQTDPRRLAEQLVTALSNPNPWSTFKSGILRCSQAEYDAERMRGILYNCLLGPSGPKPTGHQPAIAEEYDIPNP